MKSLCVYFLDNTQIHVGEEYGKLQTHQTISDELMESIFDRFSNDVQRLDLVYENDVCLTMEFGKNRESFIGIIYDEETIYYFNNGSGNRESKDLIVNACPQERMLCYSVEDAVRIVKTFCETGERDSHYQWILEWSDEM